MKSTFFKHITLGLSVGLICSTSQIAPAYAQCATSGPITTDCNLNASTTGAITLGNGSAGTTMTVVSSAATLDHAIDDDDAAADGVIAVTSGGVTVTQTAAIGATNALNRIAISAGNWTSTADITVNEITFGSTNKLTLGNAAILDANITGSTGAQTLELTGTATLGQAGNAFNLNDGNDRIEIEGTANQVLADSIDGGGGTDIIEINGSTASITSNLTNIEQINVLTADTLTMTGSIDNTTFDLEADGSALIINSGANTISSTINGTNGSDASQTVTLTSGTLSATMLMNDGDDTINLNGGSYAGSINHGSGDDTLNVAIDFTADVTGAGGNDTININANNLNSGGTIDSYETIDLNSNTYTLSHAVTDLGTADNTGVDIDSGTLNINSGGSVAGTMHSTGGSGTGTINYGANSSGGTFNIGGIIEDANIALTSGTLNTNGNVLGANSALGTITIGNNTILNANDNITSGAALTNTGTINIGATTTITADDQTASTGTFNYTIDSSTNNGQILINSGDVDMTGSTVSLNVDTSALITDGQEILIADGSAAVNGGAGQAATLINNDSFYFDFDLLDGGQAEITTGGADNTQLYAKARVANAIDDIAVTKNNATVAQVARDIRISSDPGLSQVVNAINAVQSIDEFNRVSEAIQPAADAGHFVGALTATHKAYDVARTRLAALRSGTTTGISSGSLYDTQSHFWGKAFGEYANQTNREGIDGYDARTYGVTVGIDNDITSKLTAGAAFTYANTVVESDNINETETKIHNYGVSIYGDYDITNNAYINLMGGASFGHNKVLRKNLGQVQGLDADADFGSHQFTGQAEAGYDIRFRNGLEITPSVNASYVYYTSDNYRENGAGGAGLIVSNNRLKSLELGAGLDASMMFRQVGTEEVFKPTLHVGYRNDIIGDKLETVSSFIGGGTSFKTEGYDPATETIEVGGSLEYFLPERFSFTFEYGMEFKEDYKAHQASVQAKYPL